MTHAEAVGLPRLAKPARHFNRASRTGARLRPRLLGVRRPKPKGAADRRPS